MLRDWQKLKKDELSAADRGLALSAYDECIAALDRELGKLFDALERRGVLDDTLLIVTADHGEQFGEHGNFGHGFSVYQAEVHVPLLVHFPRKVPPGHVVREAVSLRDLPSTVLELAGLEARSPFPGKSLAAFWNEGKPACSREPSVPFSELAAPIESAGCSHTSPEFSGSVQSVIGGRHAFIRHSGGAEELYDLDADPDEQSNVIDSANVELVEHVRQLFEKRVYAEPILPRSSE
jgi:arylsulfatase A-like enzyme